MLRFLRLGYRYGPRFLGFAGSDEVQLIRRAVQHLLSEAHLLKGFIRFSIQQNVLVTTIGPRNFVLPFLVRHFSERYPEEHILIYDENHQQALVYRPYEAAIIPMDCEAILVPVDGSGSSRRAVETAIALARACEARIEYLYVADLKDTLHQAEGRNQHHSVLEMAVEEGRQVLNDVLESTPADVPARGRCVSGDPPQAIMAHPLGAFYNTPHGVANAILLPHALYQKLYARLQPLYRELGKL